MSFRLLSRWVGSICGAGRPRAVRFPAAGTETRRYTNHALSYDQAKRVPRWVLEHISKSKIVGDADRKHCKFKPDPNIPPAFSAFNQDYVGSGWSRGHMAPAGNNKFSSKAMAETFYLSNIVPQDFDNNSGIWNRIEMYCRELTERFDDVWIVSGPLTLPQTGSDGKKTVSYQVRTCLSRLAALSGIMTHSVCLMPFSAVSIEHLVGCQSRGCRDGYCKELIF
uniref:Exo/endonuclease G n=1 Tax=Oryctolagus cuniculus TaxID=9986 RepID=G1TBN9_RABIT